jgi:hypothetical protein
MWAENRPRARRTKQEPCLHRKGLRPETAQDRSRLSLNFAKLMIRMSRRNQLVRLLAVAVGLVIAGCCGSGPSHKCDFSPAPTEHDGGSDAPLACGTDVCQPPQVCCLKRSPLVALCVDIENFEKDGCEKPDDFFCLVPADCPLGLSCCLDLHNVQQASVTCRPANYCPNDGMTMLTCSGSQDCPPAAPICSVLGTAPDGTQLATCGAGF